MPGMMALIIEGCIIRFGIHTPHWYTYSSVRGLYDIDELQEKSQSSLVL